MTRTARPFTVRVRTHFASGFVHVSRGVAYATEAAAFTAAAVKIDEAGTASPSATRVDAVVDGPGLGLAGTLVKEVDGTRVDFLAWIEEQGAKAAATLEAMGR